MLNRGAELVVLTQLHDRMGTLANAWVHQADRFHRPEAQCLVAALRHDFDR